MEFPRLRDIAKAIGFAAALGASSAKAEEPVKGSNAVESATFAANIKNEKAPLDLVSDLITVDPNKIHEHDKIPEDNPNGLRKKVPDVVPGVKYEIPLVEIEEARNVALKLAGTPDSDPKKREGFVGLKIDL